MKFQRIEAAGEAVTPDHPLLVALLTAQAALTPTARAQAQVKPDRDEPTGQRDVNPAASDGTHHVDVTTMDHSTSPAPTPPDAEREPS